VAHVIGWKWSTSSRELKSSLNKMHLCNHCCCGKAISIIHSECVFVVLVIQPATPPPQNQSQPCRGGGGEVARRGCPIKTDTFVAGPTKRDSPSYGVSYCAKGCVAQGKLRRERCLLDTARPPGVHSQALGNRGSAQVKMHNHGTRGTKDGDQRDRK
jgi:hypothetical protein